MIEIEKPKIETSRPRSNGTRLTTFPHESLFTLACHGLYHIPLLTMVQILYRGVTHGDVLADGIHCAGWE